MTKNVKKFLNEYTQYTIWKTSWPKTHKVFSFVYSVNDLENFTTKNSQSFLVRILSIPIQKLCGYYETKMLLKIPGAFWSHNNHTISELVYGVYERENFCEFLVMKFFKSYTEYTNVDFCSHRVGNISFLH